jgi:ATP-dependent exoDNAse (exonuclease V) beta subunit
LKLAMCQRFGNCLPRIAREAVGAKKNVLILVPKKEFFPALSRAFKKFKVPHQCPLNLLDSNHNKRLDVLECLLKWVMKPNDNFLTRLAIEEILDYGVAKVPGANKGSRCKPETIANRVRVEKEIALLWESVNAKRSLWSIVASSNSQSKSLQSIKKALVALHDSYDQDKQIDRGSFAKQLVSVSGVWGVPERFSEDFLALVNLVKGPQPTGFGSVQMLTMKKAKGLEADVVVIVGLEDDIIPGKSHLIEEEARLFYVSMTRAIEKLYLLHSYKRPRNISLGPEIIGKKRSRFLDALERPSKYLRRSIKTN